MDWKQEKELIVSEVDGIKLEVLLLIPEGEKKGIFQIHHGMSENKERYLPFMKFLAHEGYIAVIHDCRGHGRSARTKKNLGYMNGAGAWGLVEDTHQITLLMKERWPKLPVILFGHSMGSLVVRTYIKKYDDDINMLIVCGSPSKNPALKMGKMIADVEKTVRGSRAHSRLLEMASFGSFAAKFKDEKSPFAWCCSDPAVVAEYEASPLCGFPFTLDGYEALFQLMEECYSEKGWKCKNPQLPILFIGGAEDPCIGGPAKYARAVQHMRLRGYPKTKGKMYPGMRHEILNETDKKQVFYDIKKYIEKFM